MMMIIICGAHCLERICFNLQFPKSQAYWHILIFLVQNFQKNDVPNFLGIEIPQILQKSTMQNHHFPIKTDDFLTPGGHGWFCSQGAPDIVTMSRDILSVLYIYIYMFYIIIYTYIYTYIYIAQMHDVHSTYNYV